MRVCVTGAKGFIGGHVVDFLRREGHEVVPVDKEESSSLAERITGCDAIIHLAAVNRGKDLEEANLAIAQQLLQALESSGARPHLIVSSSTYRDVTEGYGSEYGIAKRAVDEILQAWCRRKGMGCTIAVIPNVYGVGCRPFYNSAIATFCHQLAHGEQPRLIEDRELEFINVEHVARKLTGLLNHQGGIVRLHGDATMRVSGILATLQRFMEMRKRGVVPDMTDPFERDLYVTLDSYVKERVTTPEVHADPRGELCELVRLERGGQVFFSTTKPGVVRGNHFHTRKLEKFCVVKGEAIIRLRKVDESEVQELRVRAPAIVDIPAFRTHNIENVGTEELLTVFWSSEILDPQDTDSPRREV